MGPRRRHRAARAPSLISSQAIQEVRDERLALTETRVNELPSDPGLRMQHAAALARSQPREAAAEALRAVQLDEAGEPMILLGAALVLVGVRELDAARSCAARAVQAAPTKAARLSLERLRERIDAIEPQGSGSRLFPPAGAAVPKPSAKPVERAGKHRGEDEEGDQEAHAASLAHAGVRSDTGSSPRYAR